MAGEVQTAGPHQPGVGGYRVFRDFFGDCEFMGWHASVGDAKAHAAQLARSVRDTTFHVAVEVYVPLESFFQP